MSVHKYQEIYIKQPDHIFSLYWPNFSVASKNIHRIWPHHDTEILSGNQTEILDHGAF